MAASRIDDLISHCIESLNYLFSRRFIDSRKGYLDTTSYGQVVLSSLHEVMGWPITPFLALAEHEQFWLRDLPEILRQLGERTNWQEINEEDLINCWVELRDSVPFEKLPKHDPPISEKAILGPINRIRADDLLDLPTIFCLQGVYLLETARRAELIEHIGSRRFKIKREALA